MIFGRSSSGSVNSTAIGSICVITTRPVASLFCTRFPSSMSRTPVTPSIGATMREYSTLSRAASAAARSTPPILRTD